MHRLRPAATSVGRRASRSSWASGIRVVGGGRGAPADRCILLFARPGRRAMPQLAVKPGAELVCREICTGCRECPALAGRRPGRAVPGVMGQAMHPVPASRAGGRPRAVGRGSGEHTMLCCNVLCHAGGAGMSLHGTTLLQPASHASPLKTPMCLWKMLAAAPVGRHSGLARSCRICQLPGQPLPELLGRQAHHPDAVCRTPWRAAVPHRPRGHTPASRPAFWVSSQHGMHARWLGSQSRALLRGTQNT